jgi:hypothetical protein
MEEKMDRPTTIMFHIDSETLNDLSHANDELIQGLHWLLARRDLAAFEKLYPIVRQITDLIGAILEGAFPEMSHVSDALNRLSDAINELDVRPARREIEQLCVAALVSDHQKLVDEVTAEVVRLNARVGSSDCLTTQEAGFTPDLCAVGFIDFQIRIHRCSLGRAKMDELG